ncbi:MAG: zf-HC2 domain-containing protein [Acidimicrobiia bacterium]
MSGYENSLTGPTFERRLAHNREMILARAAAPRPTRIERALRRVGFSAGTTRLVLATPALRRSWFAALAVTVLFALNAAGSGQGSGPERLSTFLALAPLVPLLGVALAFGPGVDRTHAMTVAAPLSGLRLLLIRSLTVVSVSIAALTMAALLVPDSGWWRVAWLLPALAVTTAAMALQTWLPSRFAVGGAGAGWLILVLIGSQITDDALGPYGTVGQSAAGIVALCAVSIVVVRRGRLDQMARR